MTIFFYSNNYDWLQLEFTMPMTIVRLSIDMTAGCVTSSYKHMGVYVGNEQASVQKINPNQKCAYYRIDCSGTMDTVDLACSVPASGRYLIVQIEEHSRYTEPSRSRIHDVSICGYAQGIHNLHRFPYSTPQNLYLQRVTFNSTLDHIPIVGAGTNSGP